MYLYLIYNLYIFLLRHLCISFIAIFVTTEEKMEKSFSLKNVLNVLAFVTLLFAILAGCFLLNIFHVRFNYTASMPIGFYWRVMSAHIKRGDLVSICLTDQLAKVALQSGYLKVGNCPSGVVPMLKQVIAIPGDTISLNNYSVTVNQTRYVAPFNVVDHNNKPIQKFITNGTYQLSDSYWVYGANDPLKSWDSRYYGAVSKAIITGVYKPLLTF